MNPTRNPASNTGSPNGYPPRTAQSPTTYAPDTRAHSLPALLIPEDYRARAVALLRGPLVYALEQADQEGRGTVDDALIDPSAPVTEHRIDALDGAVALDLDGAIAPAPAGEGYLPWDAPAPEPAAHTWRAVPYYAWANREIGPMRVWLPLR